MENANKQIKHEERKHVEKSSNNKGITWFFLLLFFQNEVKVVYNDCVMALTIVPLRMLVRYLKQSCTHPDIIHAHFAWLYFCWKTDCLLSYWHFLFTRQIFTRKTIIAPAKWIELHRSSFVPVMFTRKLHWMTDTFTSTLFEQFFYGCYICSRMQLCHEIKENWEKFPLFQK